jgi:hypothetical protein
LKAIAAAYLDTIPDLGSKKIRQLYQLFALAVAFWVERDRRMSQQKAIDGKPIPPVKLEVALDL